MKNARPRPLSLSIDDAGHVHAQITHILKTLVCYFFSHFD